MDIVERLRSQTNAQDLALIDAVAKCIDPIPWEDDYSHGPSELGIQDRNKHRAREIAITVIDIVRMNATLGYDDVIRELSRDGNWLYRTNGGDWAVTTNRGRVPADVAAKVIASGLVASVTSRSPNDAYHMGQTMDYEATMRARRNGDGCALIYVPRSHTGDKKQ